MQTCGYFVKDGDMAPIKRAEAEKQRLRKQRAQLYMQEDQFERLMRLCEFREGSKNRQAARRILLEGYTSHEAEKEGQMSRGAAGNVMRRVRRVMEDVQALHFPAVRLPPTKKAKTSAPMDEGKTST